MSDCKYDADGNAVCTWYNIQDINKYDADAGRMNIIQTSIMPLHTHCGMFAIMT